MKYLPGVLFMPMIIYKVMLQTFLITVGLRGITQNRSFCSLSEQDVSLLSVFFVMFGVSLVWFILMGKYPGSFILMYNISLTNPIF